LTAKLLDGQALSRQIQAEVKAETATWIAEGRPKPTLAVIVLGEHPASAVYVKKKQQACLRAGLDGRLLKLPESLPTEGLLALINGLNMDPYVHGILVQLPLPAHINPTRILDAVSPLKDVDGFHPDNVGRLMQGRPRFISCTPLGIQQLLLREKIETAGKRAVILGRSEIVGKPMAALLMQRGPGGEATVTVCHSRTRDLPDVTREADILIAAIGQPKFVTASMIRPGAVVIDVGINRTEDGLVGDVDFAGAREVAGWLTPVPGGVGPLTVAMLLRNTLTAARLQSQGNL